MKGNRVRFNDVVIGEEGLLKGPFGSDLKKSIYVPKTKDTYKVYLQENILKQDISKGNYYISKEYFDTNMNRYEVKEGDFIVTCDGTLGEIFQLNNIKEKGIISSSLLRITLDQSKVNHKFFPYFWQHRIKYPLIRTHENSVLKHLPGVNAIRNFEFELPELNVQKKIAFVLSSLDSKIEINNKINAELEAMAKTIYDYWFVQFDFPFDFAQGKPNAKGRLTETAEVKPYKSSGGKMVWNEELKREIPEGWEVTLMKDWIDTNKSGDWGKEVLEGNYTTKVTCLRGADINGLNGLGELKPPTRYILDKNSFKILEPNDIVVEISGGSPTQSTGRMAYITDATIRRFENPLICSNFCKPVTIKNKKLLYNFAYYWNSLYDAGIFFGYEGKTSGIKNFLFDSFVSSHYTVVPEDSVVNKFYDIMENIQTKKQTALAENQQLASLRDWLLPMLMNGQVKVNIDK